MFYLFFNSAAWTAAQERPLFSREEISNPKSALKTVSRILDGRIKFNEQLKSSFSLLSHAGVIMGLGLPQDVSPQDCFNNDIKSLQNAKNLADTLYSLETEHKHISLLWFHAFQGLSKEQAMVRERILVKDLSSIDNEYSTFYDIGKILEPFITPDLRSELDIFKEQTKKTKSKNGIAPQTSLSICAFDMIDPQSHISDPERFMNWAIEMLDTINRRNSADPSLDVISKNVQLFHRFFKSLAESKQEKLDTLTFKLCTLFKIENALVRIEKSMLPPLKLGPNPSASAGTATLKAKGVEPADKEINKKEGDPIPAEVQSLPPVLEKQTDLTEMDSPMAKAESKGKGKAKNQNIEVEDEEEQTHPLSTHLDRRVKQPSVKKIEPSSAPQTLNYSHIIEELISSKTLKFRKARDLLNQMNIRVGENLLPEDPSDKTRNKKGNGNLCIRVPHKNSQQDYSLRFFHTPHASEDNTGQRAFWRIAIKDALTEAGWI